MSTGTIDCNVKGENVVEIAPGIRYDPKKITKNLFSAHWAGHLSWCSTEDPPERPIPRGKYNASPFAQ